VAGNEAVLTFNATMVYKELKVALNERKVIEKAKVRVLWEEEQDEDFFYDEEMFRQEIDFQRRMLAEEDIATAGPQIDVPFDFIEAFLPIGGLFAAIETFFGAVKSLQNSYNPERVQYLQSQFKFNAQFRYWLIFYFPAQVAIFKAFRYVNPLSQDPMDKAQIAAACAA